MPGEADGVFGPHPPPRVVTTVEVLHGVEVADPFRGLEDGDDPATRAGSTAQNDLTRQSLDGPT